MSIKGICGKETRLKQSHFKSILSHHINVCQRIFNKHAWAYPVYRYIDAFGGPGTYEGIKGSPVIFQELAEVAGLKYDADIIEIDQDNFAQLDQSVTSSDQYRLHFGCNAEIIPILTARPTQYGLVYFDPPQDNHTVSLSFDLMRQCAERWQKIDLMLYISPALLKRTRTIDGYQTIRGYIDQINKKHWAIRSLVGKHQWTFLIGTNYIDWADWKKAGFYRIDSQPGQLVFDRANLTKEELKKKIQPRLMELIENTYITQNSEKSGHGSSNEPAEYANDANGAGSQKSIT